MCARVRVCVHVCECVVVCRLFWLCSCVSVKERKSARERERGSVCVCVHARAFVCFEQWRKRLTFTFVIFLIPHEFYKNEYINAHTHAYTYMDKCMSILIHI